MPEPIDFYFDFSSPYSYLLSEKIDALAARFGRTVRWRPILLGAVFKAAGSAPLTLQYAPKAAYSVLDFQRSARFMGLSYRHPDVFPVASQYAARACYWLEEQQPAAARPFAQAIFRALFVNNKDISSLDSVLEIAEHCRIEREALASAVQGPELKARLKNEVDAAITRGVFGAPYIVIDDQPFFGADRLPQIEHWLHTGGF